MSTCLSSLSLCAEIVILFVPPCWIHGTQKAILSDSLPCLICYHDARCYTYTHSAFWYLCRICQNSIQYFIPCKDIPPIVQSWLCHHNAIDSAPVIGNRGKPKVFVFLCGTPQVTAHLPSVPLPILSCGAFRPYRQQAFRLCCRARLHDH